MKTRTKQKYSKIFTPIFIFALMSLSLGIYSLVLAQNETESILETPNLEIPNEETQIIETPNEENTTQNVSEVITAPENSMPIKDGVAGDIAKMREHIKNNNLPEIFSKRLNEFEKNNSESIEQKIKPEKVVWSGVPATGNTKRAFKVDGFAGEIKKSNETNFAKTKKIIKKNVFSISDTSKFKLEKNEVSQNFNILDSKINSINSTAQTYQTSISGFSTLANETKSSQSIIDKATALGNNPLNILNFVREHIKYEPYYGSKKGAEATLLENEGNDADQASLLIALLRTGGTPTRYHHGVVKLTLRDVMDMVGADNSELAAKILGGANVPYSLYVDQNDNPLFFVVEMFWVEAYIEYGPYGGAIESGLTEKKWVPMIPNLVPTYYFQSLNTIDGLNATGFNIATFYEEYLNGDYGTAKPIDAFETKISDYIATQEGKTLDDAKTVGYRGFNKFEFIPATLPFEIVTDYGNYENIPNSLRYQIKFSITSDINSLLDYTAYTSDIANSELLISYDPLTAEDATFLATFPTIYDVVPLSLLKLKPVLKVNGATISEGIISAPEITAGVSAILGLTFYAPNREVNGEVTRENIEHVEKPTTIGNIEAIAIDTGNVMPPETRPSVDTQTNSAVKDQKLYRTALNYLDKLEASHDRLAEFTGGAFTDLASRAVISNSLEVTKINNTPYSFAWKGLSIDASSSVHYHSRFGESSSRHMKEFTYIFGLEASLDEATIFEEDFGVDAVSTVKALRYINQGLISGTTLKITSSNSSIIDTMNISSALKTKLYTEIANGNIIYSPSAPFTYGSWSGMVYISFDPITGSGSYIIGEGLNGGYTVEQFPAGWSNFWRTNLLPGLTATIIKPTNNQVFTIGDVIEWIANYSSPLNSWQERLNIDTTNAKVGTNILKSGYGTSASVGVNINAKATLGKNRIDDIDEIIIAAANAVSINGFILPASLFKSVLQEESGLNLKSYRYEPCYDRKRVSGIQRIFTDILTSHPYKHYRMEGYNENGQQFIKGDQVESIKIGSNTVSVSDIYKYYSPVGLDVRDSNNDGKITAYDVWDLNNSKQNYSTTKGGNCVLTEITGNFTPQFLISASYGLGQSMYPTAVGEFNFDTTPPTGSARNIGDLFLPSLEILTKSAQKLKNDYNSTTGVSGSCATGGRWWNALLEYNGGSNPNYPVNICQRYNSGTYSLLNN